MDLDNDGPPPPLRLFGINTHLHLHEAKYIVNTVIETTSADRVDKNMVNILLDSNTLEDFENKLGGEATERSIRNKLIGPLVPFQGRRSRSPKSKKMCKKRHMKWVSRKVGRKGHCVKKSRKSRK
jgi:hypothetical protein